MATNKRLLKAYLRLDGSLRVVPSSLILRQNMPKIGHWVEVPAYECCNPTTTTTSTGIPICATYSILIEEGNTATYQWMQCNGNPYTGFATPGPYLEIFCALEGTPVVFDGTAVFTLLVEGCATTTTSTTTEAPVTTTTTTTIFAPSDIRLKDNVVPTGGMIGDFKEYTWTWNSTAKDLGLDNYPTKGVIAQEVMEKRPDAVIYDKSIGYLRVNYEAIKNI